MNTSPCVNARIAAHALSRPVLEDLLKRGRSEKLDAVLESHIGLNTDMTYGQLFDCFHDAMVHEYRNEYVYKNAIANKIVLGRHRLRNVAFFTEFAVWGAVADVVVANGTTTAYEIKTEYDSFARLGKQIEIYQQVFEHVNVVIPESKLQSLLVSIPDSIGILLLSEQFTLREYRKPSSNLRMLSTEKMLGCLRASDRKRLLKQFFDVDFTYQELSHYREAKRLLLSLNPILLHPEIVQSLRDRQYGDKCKELVLQSPSSLRSILLSANYSEKSMQSILEIMNKQFH